MPLCKSEIEETGENTALLKVTIEGDEISRRCDAEYERYSKEITVPGFRKGKVPKEIIAARYGEHILEDVLGDLIAETLEGTITERKLDVIGEPTIRAEPYKGSGEFTYSAEIGLYPVFEIPDLNPIIKAIGVRELAVSENEVEAELRRLLASNATLEPVTGRASEPGDVVIVRFLSEKPPGVNSDSVYIQANKNPEDFTGRQVVGHFVGDRFSLVIKYPEDYSDRSAAGREFKTAVEITDIKERVLPELDDDFARDLGYDDLNALRAHLREKLLTHDRQRARAQAFSKLLSEIAARVTIPLSESFVETSAAKVSGVSSLDELDESTKEKALSITRNELTERIIIRKLAEMNGTKVSRLEVEKFINGHPPAVGEQLPGTWVRDFLLREKLAEIYFVSPAGGESLETKG